MAGNALSAKPVVFVELQKMIINCFFGMLSRLNNRDVMGWEKVESDLNFLRIGVRVRKVRISCRVNQGIKREKAGGWKISRIGSLVGKKSEVRVILLKIIF